MDRIFRSRVPRPPAPRTRACARAHWLVATLRYADLTSEAVLLTVARLSHRAGKRRVQGRLTR